jgi:acetoin utilization deacetylase AcuC-like enzyme
LRRIGAQLDLQTELESVQRGLLKFGQQWWGRSVVIAAQLARDARQGKLSGWLKEWDWERESPWTCVNALLATEEACSHGRCTEDLLALLERLRATSGAYNPHIAWAVGQVLTAVLKSEHTPNHVRVVATKLQRRIHAEADAERSSDDRADWLLVTDESGQKVPLPDFAAPIAIVYHPEYSHTDLHNHPESKERVQAILDSLDAFEHGHAKARQGRFAYVSPYHFLNQDWNSEAFLRLAHSDEWIRRVQASSQRLQQEERSDIVLEGDLEVRAGSYEGASLAVRGAACAAHLVISKPNVKLAMALLRPPGHLAGNKICIFNNVAIAAKYGQQTIASKPNREPSSGPPHVLIVDCDAHHGKSTNDIFFRDGSVVYFSTHQEGVHPGTGKFKEVGDGPGHGAIVNVPIPAGSGDRVYAEILRRILQPILDNFQPELILVSLGLDAYHRDEFSQLELTEWSFRELAQYLYRYCSQMPCAGVVTTLEGGYDLASMGNCVLQFMQVFGEWELSPETLPTQRLGSSSLDRYFLARDRGDVDSTLSEVTSGWRQDFSKREALLHEQCRLWQEAPSQ